MTPLTVVVSLDPRILEGAVLQATMRRPLTRTQAMVYRAVVDIHTATGRAPTYTELLSTTGFASKATIHRALLVLEQDGWIRPRQQKGVDGRRAGQVVPA